MKQPEDNKTIDVLTAKRGRPVTGKARTAAQRKQDQRARDLTKAWEEDDLNNVTVTGLIAILGMTSKPGWDSNGLIAKAAWEELGKRRGFIT